MSDCIHGIDEATCTTCATPKGTFYISKGGSAYHADRNCEWFKKGQGKAREKGLKTHPLEPVTANQAERLGKGPCNHCVHEPAVGAPRLFG